MTTSPGDTITTDLPCAHCAYNLRAQPPDGTCPECGQPVADALTNPLRVAKPRRVGMVRFGCCWLVLAIGADALTGLLGNLDAIIRPYVAPWIPMDWVFWPRRAAVAAGGFLLLSRIRRDAVRHALMVLYGLVLVLMLAEKISVTELTMIPLTQHHLMRIYFAIGVVLFALPLTGVQSRWATPMWLTVVICGVLHGAYLMVRAAHGNVGVMPSVVQWWAAIMTTLWMLPVVFVALHAATIARKCSMAGLDHKGTWIARAVIGGYALNFAAFVVSAAMYVMTKAPLNSEIAFVSYMVVGMVFYGANLALVVYLVLLARRLRV